MITQKMEWEQVNVPFGRHPNRTASVWIEKVGPKSVYARLKISSDIVSALGWSNGTRVNLFRSGNLFKMVQHKTGLITFKMHGNQLQVNGWALCAELHPDINGTEFDAWVDDGELYFRPKEQ